MSSSARMVRGASGIMVFLGIGHLLVIALLMRGELGGWLERGLWAAVPLGGANPPTYEALRTDVAFWAGVGSFSVPLILLGALTWHLVGRGVSIPSFVGWALIAWCALGGVLLVPSPFFVGTIAGVLIVLASRRPQLTTH